MRPQAQGGCFPHQLLAGMLMQTLEQVPTETLWGREERCLEAPVIYIHFIITCPYKTSKTLNKIKASGTLNWDKSGIQVDFKVMSENVLPGKLIVCLLFLAPKRRVLCFYVDVPVPG